MGQKLGMQRVDLLTPHLVREDTSGCRRRCKSMTRDGGGGLHCTWTGGGCLGQGPAELLEDRAPGGMM